MTVKHRQMNTVLDTSVCSEVRVEGPTGQERRKASLRVGVSVMGAISIQKSLWGFLGKSVRRGSSLRNFLIVVMPK